jgi:hypothetical protein
MLKNIIARAFMAFCLILSAQHVLADLSPMQEKKLKREIEEVVTESAGAITAKHPDLALELDWQAYDNLDWVALGKKRASEMPFLKGHISSFGNGFNAACKDDDYKEELVKVTRIILTPATEEGPSKKAQGKLDGTTLTITFDSLGGTLGADDWKKGIESAY